MEHPFQCIQVVHSQSNQTYYLLSACGPHLSSTNLSTGDTAATWIADGEIDQATGAQPQQKDEDQSTERPLKKQKTKASPSAKLPNIIRLTASPDNRHAVAVTDDKHVRVFAIMESGQLAELSRRPMPKRPCAVQVLPDNSTILCGDKFGDVYSLPLLPAEPDIDEPETAIPEGQAAQHPVESGKSFKPSATDKTVHTKRNLKSLESQMKQKNLTPRKEPLAFEHTLLLGHVSVLTDLTYATAQVDGKQRGFIITADRDEHIRVSRGPPHSHIIEGYCLGHTDFVSKICAIPDSNLLVSGGGNDWLGLWDWPSSKLIWKFDRFGEDMRTGHFPEDAADIQEGPVTNFTMAVSGMWLVSADGEAGAESVLIVASEKMPLLAYCPIAELGRARNGQEPFWKFEEFNYPVLDVASIGSTMLLSFDVRETGQPRVVAYKLHVRWGEVGVLSVDSATDKAMNTKLSSIVGTSVKASSGKDLDDLLYGIANLRKRANHDEAAVAEDAD